MILFGSHVSTISSVDFAVLRQALADMSPSPKVEPNERIEVDRAYFPDSHRGALDSSRQLVVGNRGMGKSFWAHALLNAEIRQRLSDTYRLTAPIASDVVLGFNGSTKLAEVAPTVDDVSAAHRSGCDPDLIWRATLVRAARSTDGRSTEGGFAEVMKELERSPQLYATILSKTDERLKAQGRRLLVVFDALDRLAHTWVDIRALTKGLLVRAVGLRSFHSIRAKVFMRVDQAADEELFRFPDGSKLVNDRVDLSWPAFDLYGLLLFEILRNQDARPHLEALASSINAAAALPLGAHLRQEGMGRQGALIAAMAGELMGSNKRKGRVYTWVPLHLGDAAKTCSPRTFLTAWQTAARHVPAPVGRVVDHLGLQEGVRRASGARLSELREDYPWIDAALEPLRGAHVPILREELFALWDEHDVVGKIMKDAEEGQLLAPFDLFIEKGSAALLKAMTRVAVMEERANGKINVPDIFRVKAGILRMGGVAVPR